MVDAIKMYLHIATKPAYSKFKRMDEVLFNVADMLNQAKRRDKARIFFRKLIRNYPQSKYIPDAYLSFAEFYFNDGQVENALKLYEQVGKYPNSPIYGYAIYKQGWCWLNLKDPRRALEMFVKVIKNASKWGGTQEEQDHPGQGGQEGLRAGLRPRGHAGEGLELLPAHRRLVRDEDARAAGQPLLRSGQVPALDPDLPQADRAQPQEQEALQLAVQHREGHAVGQGQAPAGGGGPSAWPRSTGR